jgi:hypothetical protein
VTGAIAAKRSGTDFRNGLLCALLAIAATLATLPFVESPVNDDWAFTKMALDFAETGQLRFNGWSVPIVGIQAIWGGLFVKIFGFSFTAVRLSILPFLAGCAILLYLLLRRGGVSPFLSAFATLTILVSPIALPLAASFMTDIPGLFFILLTLYAAIRAAETTEEPKTAFVGWVLLAAVAGYLGGTIRQVIWITPLLSLGYLAFQHRDRRPLVLTALIVTLLLAAATQFWYTKQPYSISEDLRAGLVHIVKMPRTWLPLMTKQILTSLLFLMPIVVLALPSWGKSLAVRRMGIIAAVAGIVTALCFWRNDLAPWIGNIVTANGILGTESTMLGTQPVTLPVPLQLLLTALILLAAGIIGLYAAVAVRTFLAATPSAAERRTQLRERWNALPAAVQYLVVFTVPYLLLLMPRAALGYAFDRYILPALPLVALLMLRPFSSGNVPSVLSRIAAGTAFFLYAFYGIATTHDYLARLDAERQAIADLVKNGVPRHAIRAGFEQDSWTELTLRGFYNSYQYTNPPGAYLKPGSETYPPPFQEKPLRFWWENTPSLSYSYFIVTSPQTGLVDAPLTKMIYRTWLPPFTRELRVQKLAQLPTPVSLQEK